MDCNHTFPIDLAPKGIQFGAKSLSEKCDYNPNLVCNHFFPIDLATSGLPFDAKSIGKVWLQYKFGLI